MNKQKAKAQLKDQWKKTQEQHFGKEKTVETKPYERCFHGHPALALGQFKVYGGSASSPVVKDADIYVALDRGSYDRPTYPWHKKGPVTVLFRITDMHKPDDKVEFSNMIGWLTEQIEAGKKVHIGCIGGHGRTGTVLAALAARFGIEDPIGYVRKNYCHKAVESQEQIDFLVKEWGAKPAEPSKKPTASWKDRDEDYDDSGWHTGTGGGLTYSWKGYGKTYDKKPVDSGQPQDTTFSVWSKEVTWQHPKKKGA